MRKRQLQRGCGVTPRICLEPIPIPHTHGCTNRKGLRKEVPESMMFADDIVLCGGREVDMTEYLDTWRKSLEERGMMLSRPKTQFMDFNFEKNQQGNREPVKILGEELERVTHLKYLGTSMEEEGGMETEITKRVGAGWSHLHRYRESLRSSTEGGDLEMHEGAQRTRNIC